MSILLYRDGRSVWRQGMDTVGPIDVAVLELDRECLPQGIVIQAFEPRHIQLPAPEVEVGASVRVVGVRGHLMTLTEDDAASSEAEMGPRPGSRSRMGPTRST